MRIKPLHDQVIVRPIEVPQGDGLVRPDIAEERPSEGLVLEVGPGRFAELTGVLVPVSVKPGDRVLYGRFAGNELEGAAKGLVMLRDIEITGTVEYTPEELELQKNQLQVERARGTGLLVPDAPRLVVVP